MKFVCGVKLWTKLTKSQPAGRAMPKKKNKLKMTCIHIKHRQVPEKIKLLKTRLNIQINLQSKLHLKFL